MIPIILYTHTDYSDVLDLSLRQLKKYDLERDVTLFCNKQHNYMPTIIYDDSKPYASRMLQCIQDYNEDIFLFLHEDFILYGPPHRAKLNHYYYFLQDFPKFPFIRLLKTDEKIDILGPEPELFATTNYFAIQSTLFRRDYLLGYLSKYREASIWELEGYRQENPNNGLYTYSREFQRGSAHYDSSVLPCMATAIVKGKWNHEYKKELLELESEKFFSYRGWTS